jgi:predicted RNA-binding protein with PIN domain
VATPGRPAVAEDGPVDAGRPAVAADGPVDAGRPAVAEDGAATPGRPADPGDAPVDAAPPAVAADGPATPGRPADPGNAPAAAGPPTVAEDGPADAGTDGGRAGVEPAAPPHGRPDLSRPGQPEPDGAVVGRAEPDGAGAGRSEPAGGGAAEAVALPETVRMRVVALAAEALGRLPADEVPAALRAVARFTPAKRAKLGSTVLAAALEADAAFRLGVAVRAEQAAPAIIEAVRNGDAPAAADPMELAAAAYLLRVPGWPAYVERARSALGEVAERAQAREREAELNRLRAEIVAVRESTAAEVARLQAAATAAQAEADALRRQLREQTGSRRAAERARVAADEALAEERRRAATAESTAHAEVRRLRQRWTEAEDAVESARRAAKDSRQADEARLWLLLDTVAGAVQGLRRELALTPTDERPADAVSAVTPGHDQQGARGDDPDRLDRLLALPRVHLVVDGYNVTKSGYGELPLAAQRNRLVQGLGALAARTRAEVSCVFDGAARPPVAPPAPRGVRVLFSAAGETADDLIRRLVAAEPMGRPVVVVSTDREVAEGVQRQGVYPVPSAVLLRRLDRG